MGKTINHIFAFLATTLLLSSCINLRYTNYGKPFDFLSAKNHNYKIKQTEKDTAAVCHKAITEEPNVPCEIAESNEVIVIAYHTETTDIIETGVSENSETPSEASNDLLSVKEEKKAPRFVHSKKFSFVPGDVAVTVTPWPPEWWRNMWSNFWNWVLKWLLIIFIFLVVLALIIWGIYALISILAGPAVAGIVVCCIILLLYLLIEFS